MSLCLEINKDFRGVAWLEFSQEDCTEQMRGAFSPKQKLPKFTIVDLELLKKGSCSQDKCCRTHCEILEGADAPFSPPLTTTLDYEF